MFKDIIKQIECIFLLVSSLKCFVTGHEPNTRDEFGMPITDNGTSWKWMPAGKVNYSIEAMVDCDDTWKVCASRQPRPIKNPESRFRIKPFSRPFPFEPIAPVFADPTIGPDENETTGMTNTPTTTTTPIPPRCIACGKATWKKMGLQEQEGEELVALGCYGSDIAEEVAQMSCSYVPRGNPGCHKTRSFRDNRAIQDEGSRGGDICSRCFCDEDGCNGSNIFSVGIKQMFGLLLFWLFH